MRSVGTDSPLAGLVLPEDRIYGFVAQSHRSGEDQITGQICTPFDLAELELEVAPRSVVSLQIQRADIPSLIDVHVGKWRLKTDLDVDDKTWAHLNQTADCLARACGKGCDGLEDLPSSWLAWALADLADHHATEKRWDAAAEALEASVGLDLTPAVKVNLDMRLALVEKRRNRPEEAAWLFHLALNRLAGSSNRPLTTAQLFNNLGNVSQDMGDLEGAAGYHNLALALRSEVAPGSLAEAASYNNWGFVALRRGEIATGEICLQKALAIKRRLLPGGSAEAASLTNLGSVLWAKGDLIGAAELIGKALDIQLRVAPDSLAAASAYSNLAGIAIERGNFLAAAAHLRQSLAIKTKIQPDSIWVANSLHHLALIEAERQHLDSASEFLVQAIAIKQQVAPGSLELAASMLSLGAIELQRGQSTAARDLMQSALGIQREAAPDSPDVSATLAELARLEEQDGNLEVAEALTLDALERRVESAPRGLFAAARLTDLARLSLANGKTDEASKMLGQARAIQERLAQGSIDLAHTLQMEGRVAEVTGDVEGAAQLLVTALDVLDTQVNRLGGGYESRSRYRAEASEMYRLAFRRLLANNRNEEAFAVAERSRSRDFLIQLAERDVVSHELSPGLKAERREISDGYDRAIAELNSVADPEAPEVKVIDRHLIELRRRQEDLRERIRETAPHLAALQAPTIVTATEARRFLAERAPKTVILSYVVDDSSLTVFALRADADLEVRVRAASERELRDKVALFTRMISESRHGRAPEELLQMAEELYDLLVAPVEDIVESAERIVVCPDGPLHGLAFSALRRPSSRGEPAYLAELKPLSVVLSVSLLVEIERRTVRPSGGNPTLVAFGDPRYPGVGIDDSQSLFLTLMERGSKLSPLPESRVEVEAISSLFPRGSAEIFLGERATEENARQKSESARYVHFACHAVLDEHRPLDSALALTIPDELIAGQRNGFLQAWEVFESLKLNADLVVLSACSTALGEEIKGEGLVGLSRAFLHAGSRSVVASLWNVSDRSTSLLMQALYRRLLTGKPVPEALREAQLELIHGTARSPTRRFDHPYYWAAFQVVGGTL